jgi:hypothetical protein
MADSLRSETRFPPALRGDSRWRGDHWRIAVSYAVLLFAIA